MGVLYAFWESNVEGTWTEKGAHLRNTVTVRLGRFGEELEGGHEGKRGVKTKPQDVKILKPLRLPGRQWWVRPCMVF